MTDAATPPAAATPAPARTRPFYWSVRRELWEHRVYLAPAIVGAIALVGFLLGLHGLPDTVQAVAHAPNPATHADVARQRGQLFVMLAPFGFGAGAVLLTALIVGIFYSLGSLHNERRDRSVLFWKSLPVSDRTTVLSKAFIPLAVLPVVVLAVVVTVLAIMVGLASVVLTSSGVAPETLLSRLPTFGAMTLGVAYALVILSLWYAPIVGWLMLVSVWARRMTFLWAVAPPFGLCLLEMLALRTVHVWNFLHERLIGGFAAYTVGGLGKAPLHDLSQIDVTPFLTDPGFWGGLVFAAVAFEACVRLRRRREPI